MTMAITFVSCEHSFLFDKSRKNYLRNSSGNLHNSNLVLLAINSQKMRASY